MATPPDDLAGGLAFIITSASATATAVASAIAAASLA